ncbi:MAG: glutamate-5-semialdehyde dehydrogenase [Cyanophyceae cyanobacterium]
MVTSLPRQSTSLTQQAEASRAAAKVLASLPTDTRNLALDLIAQELTTHQDQILAANQRDLERAQIMVAAQDLTPSAYARLQLTESKLATMIAGIRDVKKLPELVGQAQFVRELDEGLILERRTCPLGVLGIIFESRPDAVTQIVSLAIKTGNSVLLKGGSEALESCQTLVTIIHQALSQISGFPLDCVQLLTTREEIRALLELDHVVDLIIPRGSNEFVRYIQTHTRIPVMGHADGLCHLYVDQAADVEMGIRLAVDAKTQYPAACNAIETLLVHEAIAPTYLPAVAAALQAQGVTLRGCDQTRQWIAAQPATPEDWTTEYGDLILAIRVVADVAEAMHHIQTYGSRHTEGIVTQDPAVADLFLDGVDAAGVFHNASTRFADGYRYGFGAEVGISTQKMPPRGPVGIEGLVTYTYRLKGSGQIVADYSGPQGRAFTHRDR